MDSSSYMIEPHDILSYDSMKSDGTLPEVRIGKKCSIAKNCTFVLSNHVLDVFCTTPSIKHLFPHGKGNPSGYSKGDIDIKNDVWIGANCTILDGVTIGNGAVVAAGSVVCKDVPPYAVVGGNPTKLIRYRFSKEIIDELDALQFWEMDMSEISTFDIHTRDIKDLIRQVKEYKATRRQQIGSS
jgi:hypothetical protein